MSDTAIRSTPLTIDRQAPLSPAEDFVALKAQALEWLPRWCSREWTNFNENDPGVMILEQIIYAFTELAYRARLPMDRLLSDARGKIAWHENSLFAPTDILPMQALTADDYVRMLYDRIPELVYAWVGPLPPADQGLAPGLSGLLQARVAVSPDANPKNFEHALGQAGALLSSHCNLGERFESISAQPFVFFELTVNVQLAPGAMPDIVRGNLYLAVKQALLPGPHFLTLAQALKDQTIDVALSGPLLQRGVLVEDDLPGPWRWIEVKERVVQAILGVAWVQAVTSIVFSNEAEVMAQSLSAPQLYAPALHTAIRPLSEANPGRGAQADYCVTFKLTPPLMLAMNMAGLGFNDARQNMFIQAGGDAPSVQFGRLLSASTWAMPPIPDEPTTVVGEYSSIQNTFPGCFALHADALSPLDPPPRRAQVWQLKGYLLVFEQLMANYFAQLAGTSAYFSNRPQTRTVFTQPLSNVPGVLPLLIGCNAGDFLPDPVQQAERTAAYWADPANPYISGLHAASESIDLRLERRDAVLDQLLARFNESFPMVERTTYETIVNKENLLQAYPKIGFRRAAAADLTNGLAAGALRPRSGLEEKIQLLLRRDTQKDPAPAPDPSGSLPGFDSADFYFVLEPIRFLPRADSVGAGERWNLPLGAFVPSLFHVYINWTLCPLTRAFINYVEALVGENAPVHLWSRHIWLETRPVAEANVERFRLLFQAWAQAGYPLLVLASPRLDSDPPLPPGTIDVCQGTPAADLFAWLLDQFTPPVPGGSASS